MKPIYFSNNRALQLLAGLADSTIELDDCEAQQGEVVELHNPDHYLFATAKVARVRELLVWVKPEWKTIYSYEDSVVLTRLDGEILNRDQGNKLAKSLGLEAGDTMANYLMYVPLS